MASTSRQARPGGTRDVSAVLQMLEEMDSESDSESETESDQSELEVDLDITTHTFEDSNEESEGSSCDSSEVGSPVTNASGSASHVRSTFGYFNHDNGPPVSSLKSFHPNRSPGLHIPDVSTRSHVRRYTTAMSIFMLFFTEEIVRNICNFTNQRAYSTVTEDSAYATGGVWEPVSVNEMYLFIACLMYMSIVKVPSQSLYWSSGPLYNGLWARRFLPQKRFKAILSMLRISPENTATNASDKLGKVRFLYEAIKSKCKTLYQPRREISIDERMVRSKGRFNFRQYMKDKPIKWGFKLFVLAESATGYTYDFEIYTGKQEKEKKSQFGLAYDVIVRLTKGLCNQGYHLFIDNFYTSVRLLRDLFMKALYICGTVIVGRRGIPNTFKDKSWGKSARRGQMRWTRDKEILYLQWKDNKTVTFMSTFHTANRKFFVNRRTKDPKTKQFKRILVRQPQIVKDYNKNMGGVDLSDQLIGRYNCLRKTNKWWKTLFFHLVDICKVNSFVLFKHWQDVNSDVEELHRRTSYGQREFVEELICQLAHIEDDEEVPTAKSPSKVHCTHNVIPSWDVKKKNCKLCYRRFSVERKTYVKCSSCNNHLCFTRERNCLLDFHT